MTRLLRELKFWLCYAGAMLLSFTGAKAENADWQNIIEKAKGQEVVFYAWGGDPRINAYISWVADQVKADYDIDLRQVKASETALGVSQIRAERLAGLGDQAGRIDLIWINGENFAQMKQEGLLFGPFAEQLPNFAFIAECDRPAVLTDFTIPTEGYESPWGTAQFNFIYDPEQLKGSFPQSMAEFVAWAEQNAGLLSYPQPPNFLGSTFLKQVLLELWPDDPRLFQDVSQLEAKDYASITAPLWDFLDRLHPHLWRQGRAFPLSGPQQSQLIEDGEQAMMLSFTPSEGLALKEQQRLPKSIKIVGLKNGTIGNTHFVAIPYNSAHKQAAMVVANFLLSPLAQAKKQDIRVWGDASVLPQELLRPELEALGAPQLGEKLNLGARLNEPHPSWMVQIERDWLERYAR